jgi:hypothetical protein
MFFQHPSTINAEGTQPSTPKAITHKRREAEKRVDC